MNTNFLLHFLNFSQNVDFCLFLGAKHELPILLFPRIKQPDARKRRSAKQRRIQEEENTTILHAKHVSPTPAFSKSHLRFQELQILPSM